MSDFRHAQHNALHSATTMHPLSARHTTSRLLSNRKLAASWQKLSCLHAPAQQHTNTWAPQPYHAMGYQTNTLVKCNRQRSVSLKTRVPLPPLPSAGLTHNPIHCICSGPPAPAPVPATTAPHSKCASRWRTQYKPNRCPSHRPALTRRGCAHSHRVEKALHFALRVHQKCCHISMGQCVCVFWCLLWCASAPTHTLLIPGQTLSCADKSKGPPQPRRPTTPSPITMPQQKPQLLLYPQPYQTVSGAPPCLHCVHCSITGCFITALSPDLLNRAAFSSCQ